MAVGLEERVERLRAEAAAFAAVPEADIRVVRSPYRVCPLGAHVDHQLGRVTGLALDRCVLLAFAPGPEGLVRLHSLDFGSTVEFPLHDPSAVPRESWGRYAAGAARALLEQTDHRITRGLVGVVGGELPIGGLSSSAAVSVAYLLALEDVNDAQVGAAANICLEQFVENVHIGLNNGILDQSVILLSRPNHLLFLDCFDQHWELIPAAPGAADFRIVVAYSGLSQSLVSTGYNSRVAECRAAAEALLRLACMEADVEPVLRDVPMEVYQAFASDLDPVLARRARHFFSENVRVLQSRRAWDMGDLPGFGALINASGQSSIDNYECGSPELIALYETLRNCPGVYGARFSGAGFRGSCIGLCEPGAEGAIRAAVDRAYPTAHPHVADRYEVHFCESADGASLL